MRQPLLRLLSIRYSRFYKLGDGNKLVPSAAQLRYDRAQCLRRMTAHSVVH